MACPFHEDAGPIPKGKSVNFYVSLQSGAYLCHSASCGERGNLLTLERFFGEDTSTPDFVSREQRLQFYEEELPRGEIRQPFYDHGLNDTTIERFRFGYDPIGRHYVIPYLEQRRPRAFRLYSPEGHGPHGSKYWWEKGTDARLFNAPDAFGDMDKGQVILAEGEQKAALLVQMGYAAVAVPGAGIFKPEWDRMFHKARKIVICFDNDSPEHHVYTNCSKCGAGRCHGHNPGQEAATKLVSLFEHRARNVVLPRPKGESKVDVNEFLIRDKNTPDDLAELLTGVSKTPYRMVSLQDLCDKPPEESAFIVEQGILPKGGRLLITGAPKAGKSIAAENLALSIAAGVPFLNQYQVDKPRRVGLLDREISRRSLFDRFGALVEARPSYKAAMNNLFIDHDLRLKLDDPRQSLEPLLQLVEQNGLDVIMFDSAYKFFAKSFTNEDAVSKGFETLDTLIAETGVSVVLMHHHRKRGGDRSGKKEGPGDPDDVVGSFLWTGWPNGTILLNFLQRRVQDPFNTVCTFAAFRDAAPPDPVALYRDKSSVAYTDVRPYSFEEDGPVQGGDERFANRKPNADLVGELLLDVAPMVYEDFIHLAQAKFGCGAESIRPHLVDLLLRGDFIKTGTRPSVIKFANDVEEESYQDEQIITGSHGSTTPQLSLVPTLLDTPNTERPL